MNTPDLERLIRLVGDMGAGDGSPSAPGRAAWCDEPNPPAIGSIGGCLPMARLAQLARQPGGAPPEQRHLADCPHCAARLRAFLRPSLWSRRALRLRPLRLVSLQVLAVAATVALFTIWTPRVVHPRMRHVDARAPLNRGGFLMPGIVQWAHSCIEGDADCDGYITDDDTNAFFLAVNYPEQYRQTFGPCEITCGNDLNHDGVVDHNDIAPFVACMFPH